MIRVHVDTGGPRQTLRGMIKRADNLSPILKAFRGTARKDIMLHGRKAEGPDGAWVRRARRKSRRGKRKRTRLPKARRLLGRLSTAIDFETDRNSLTIESLAPWSSIHQEGGRAGHGARIPKRVFLWLSPWALFRLSNSIGQYIVPKKLRRKK